MKVAIDFGDYKPWSGAVDTLERINAEDKMDALEAYIEEVHGSDTIEDGELNDILWHDSDSVYRALGMKPDDTDKHTAAEIAEEWKDSSFCADSVVGAEFGADGILTIKYLEEDDDTVYTEKLDEDGIAEVYNADHCEVNAEDGTAETWSD